jgi:hypothetical protein
VHGICLIGLKLFDLYAMHIWYMSLFQLGFLILSSDLIQLKRMLNMIFLTTR